MSLSTLPEFTTDRLILRAPRASDASSWERHFNDKDVIFELFDAVPWPYPAGGALSYFNDVLNPGQGQDHWAFGLFLREKPDEMIGLVTFYKNARPDHRGFWLGRAFWGQGLMSEALLVLTTYAFDHLGYDRLILTNASLNTRSKRLKEKVGATFLHRAPAKFVNPDYTEMDVWELTKDAWNAYRQKETSASNIAP